MQGEVVRNHERAPRGRRDDFVRTLVGASILLEAIWLGVLAFALARLVF